MTGQRKTYIYEIKWWDGRKWHIINTFRGKNKSRAESWMFDYVRRNGYFLSEFTLSRREAE